MTDLTMKAFATRLQRVPLQLLLETLAIRRTPKLNITNIT